MLRSRVVRRAQAHKNSTYEGTDRLMHYYISYLCPLSGDGGSVCNINCIEWVEVAMKPLYCVTRSHSAADHP